MSTLNRRAFWRATTSGTTYRDARARLIALGEVPQRNRRRTYLERHLAETFPTTLKHAPSHSGSAGPGTAFPAHMGDISEPLVKVELNHGDENHAGDQMARRGN